MNGDGKLKPNSYKSLRLTGKTYDIMYAVHCFNHSHELYNMKKDPIQMVNLHPKAPAPKGKKNAFNRGQKKLSGMAIKKLLPRLDALLMVLKSCKGSSCKSPWKELHPSGNVKNLRDAMAPGYDSDYHNMRKVRYNKCHKTGVINLHDEGPQWNPGMAIPGRSMEDSFMSDEDFESLEESEDSEFLDKADDNDDSEDSDETDPMPEIVEPTDEEYIAIQERIDQGYMDDWE